MYNVLKQSKGFTLVEVMVVVAILGIVSYVAVGGLVQAVSYQSELITKDEASQFTSGVAFYLNNQALCTAELKGQSFPVGAKRGVELRNYKGYGDAIGVLKSSAAISNKLKLTEMELIHKQSVPVQTMTYGSGTNSVYVGQFKISLTLTTGSRTRPLQPFFVEFPIVVDSANNIVSCQVGFDMRDACQALGMSYDTVLGVCKPDTACVVNGSYVKTTCTPSTYGCDGTYVADNPVTAAKTCPTGSSAKMTGELVYTHTVSTGKKSTATVQNQARFYLCMKCS